MMHLFLLKALVFSFAISDIVAAKCKENDTVVYIRMSEVIQSVKVGDEIIAVEPGLPLTPTCLKSCDKADNCSGIAIDYKDNKCILYKQNILPENLVNSRRFSLFNKTCLKEDAEIPESCMRKGWQADLWLGWTLRDENQVLHNTTTLNDCILLCLTDSSCGSVSFDNGFCAVHQKSSRRAPKDIQAKKNMILVDNWCPQDSVRSCSFSAWSGLVTVNSDINITLPSAKDCEEKCEKSEDIPCWTYTYNETSQVCSLSADNNMLIPDQSYDSVYGERQCISHGRWTRQGACICDVTAGGGHNSKKIVNRIVTFIHDVREAAYDAMHPGRDPETACQCMEKPMHGKEAPVAALETAPVQQEERPVVLNNYFPPVEAPPRNYPPPGGYPWNYYDPNTMQGFSNPYYTSGSRGK